MKDLKCATQLAFEEGTCNTHVNVYKNGRILFTTNETTDLLTSWFPLFEAKINTKLNYKGEKQRDEEEDKKVRKQQTRHYDTRYIYSDNTRFYL